MLSWMQIVVSDYKVRVYWHKRLITYAANIDLLMMHFLEKYFPREVKAKQKENEIAAGIDLYGENYTAQKCVVM